MEALAIILATHVAVSDFYARRVPNKVLVSATALCLIWHFAMLGGAVPSAPPSLLTAFIGMTGATCMTIPFYIMRWMGAGDVKMATTLGLILGFNPWLFVWLTGTMIVGAHTLLLLSSHLFIRMRPQIATWQAEWHKSSIYQRIQKPYQGRKGMPFAAYMGIGVFVYVFAGSWLGIAP